MEKRVIIGRGNPSGQNVAIEASARARSTYVIGITGTGKSTLLETMAYQDMANRDGLCFLDPHGDSAKKLLASVPDYREPDVIFWDPSDIDRPFGFNPFYCSNSSDELEVSNRAQSFIDALGSLREFASIFESAPRMKNMLQQLATTFIINQGHTLAETPKFLTTEEYRQQFYPALSARFARVRRYWEEELDSRSERERREITESSLNKLERFQSDPVLYSIFGQPTNSIDLRKAMDAGAIIIINLGADRGGFIGAFVVWELLQAAFSRADIPEHERRPFHLFADEFQTYMTTAFPKLQAQARKYGVDTVIAHQVRAQLTPEIAEITPAVGNLVIFRITGHNANSLSWEFDSTPPPGEPVLKPITSRTWVNDPVYEERWVDKNAEAEYAKNAVELGAVAARAALLTHCLGVAAQGEFSGNAYYDLDRSLSEFLQMAPDHWNVIHRRLNPFAYSDNSDRDHFVHYFGEEAYKQAYWYGQRMTFDFPTSWPSFAEHFLQGWIKDGRSGLLRMNWGAIPQDGELDDGAEKRIAAALLEEIGKLLVPFKERAGGYVYDRACEGDFSLFSKWEGDEIDNKRWDGHWEIKAFPDAVQLFKSMVTGWKAQIGELKERQKRLREAYLKKLETHPAVYDEQVVRHEWVPGLPRQRTDVAAEIANQLVGLPNFQAKCKLTQENARPAEHLILTFDYPGDENQELAQRLRKKSRDQFGRDRRDVEHATEERLRIGRDRDQWGSGANVPKTDAPTRPRNPSHAADDEEPIIREKAKAKTRRGSVSEPRS